MIVDSLQNINDYQGITWLKEAIDYINTHDLSELPDGITKINGDDLYVNVQEVQEKDIKESGIESHELYADLQIMLRGGEKMGYKCVSDLSSPREERPSSDVKLYDMEEGVSWQDIKEGMFAIFLPQDGHAPGVRLGNDTVSRKAVFKIRL